MASQLPYSTYLIDLDGVVYRGNELIPGAKEFVDWLDANHKKYLFLTNNSFATLPQIIAKLEHLGISTKPEHMMSAGQAAIQHIERARPGGTVYVVGEESLIELVREHNLQVVSPETTEADAVLVGLDRDFNYLKLTNAVDIVRNGGMFVAINRDPLLPIVGGLIPGCGAMVAAIEAASGTTPEVVGKPEPLLLQEAMVLLQSTPEETVMVGDGLDVDILAGKSAGTHTLFVLSGRNQQDDIEKLAIYPDHTYKDLAEVLTVLKSEQEQA
jgi:HAD superfamily hydrolase (TIGR01457 family)